MPNFLEDIVRGINSEKKAIESPYQDDSNLQKPKKQKNTYTTVSYTHLTLPTIYSV